MVPQNLFMLALFGDFYRKAYMGAKKGEKQTAITDEQFHHDVQGLCYTRIADSDVRKRTKLTSDAVPESNIEQISENETNSYDKKRLLEKATINGNFLLDKHYTWSEK